MQKRSFENVPIKMWFPWKHQVPMEKTVECHFKSLPEKPQSDECLKPA